MTTADGPFPWFLDHEMVVENPDESQYDLGVDKDGDVLIRFEGHCSTISPRAFRELFEAAHDDYMEVLTDA